MEAIPLALDVDVAGFGDPAPLMTAQLIVTPATGLLNWSATRTDSGVGSVCPTVPVWRSPPFTAICVAPATLAVMVNVTVGRPVTAAVVVCVPGVGPSVRVVVAWPFTSVSDDVGLTEPPPEAGAQVTVTFPTGLLLASVTSTLCGVASVLPTCPVRLSPENFASVAGAPATPVAVNVRGLPVSPGDVAVSVYGPAVLPRVQLPTAAMPVASVVWFAPETVPPLVPGAKVTATPATGLLLASRTITDGGMATAVPVVAF